MQRRGVEPRPPAWKADVRPATLAPRRRNGRNRTCVDVVPNHAGGHYPTFRSRRVGPAGHTTHSGVGKRTRSAQPNGRLCRDGRTRTFTREFWRLADTTGAHPQARHPSRGCRTSGRTGPYAARSDRPRLTRCPMSATARGSRTSRPGHCPGRSRRSPRTSWTEGATRGRHGQRRSWRAGAPARFCQTSAPGWRGASDDRGSRRACLPVATRRGEARNTPYDLGFRRDTDDLLATGVASL